jgi:Leucine-rich repeat (LRR) protein
LLRGLFLSNNQLSGSIPKELGQLASLRLLWLYCNQLSGSIPNQLGRLRRLRGLELDNNKLDTLSWNIRMGLGTLLSCRCCGSSSTS